MYMSVEIICPLYNAVKYIKQLHNSLIKQEGIITKITYLLTESKDETEKWLKKNKINYEKISKKEFSHSLTREKAALNSKADIIVFITQDIEIEDNYFIKKLIKNIEDNKAEASYARQITKYDNIEKYTREKNYPEKSRIVSKKNIELLGLNTFFSSDAASAIRTDIFKKLNGYDNKKLPISEDMYITYKLIMNDYRVCYESNAVVYHSHDFTLKELYERYKLTGQFFKENSYLDKYGTNKSGGSLAKYILKRAIEDKNIKVLLRFIPDMSARFIGMKVGKYGK